MLKFLCIWKFWKVAQSKQAVSVANTQSIINSLMLSFPRSNHSTQQHWNPASSCKDQWLLLLLLPLWEKHKLPKRRTHKYLRPQTVVASGLVALYGPTLQEGLYKSLCAWSEGTTWPDSVVFCLFFVFHFFVYTEVCGSCCLQGQRKFSGYVSCFLFSLF